jgi:very-short-patch-repair endonuclease
MRRKPGVGIVSLARCRIAGRRLGIDRAIHAVAALQHGVIARSQLIALGLSANGIDARVKRGRLFRMQRGVYRVGPVLGPLGQEMAAVLACRPKAFLSHQSAAFAFKLTSDRPPSVHLTVVRRELHRPGLICHQTVELPTDEATEIDGVPATTPTRTILDLALTADIERLLAEAYARHLTTRPKLLSLLARYPTRRGTRALRAVLETTPARTRSKPERRLLSLIRLARLPPPQVNAKLHNWEVDFLWPDRKLIVEVDALSTHTSPRAFERDRRKDAELTLLGYTVVRVTRRQIEGEPEALVARLAAFLYPQPPLWRQTAQP